jgi:hypothetical protein
MGNTAIVIFAFKRFDHLSETLAHLNKVENISEIPICFFLDGARNSHDKEATDKVKLLVDHYAHPLKQIVVQSENFGLRKSVITGLNSVFKTYDEAIVLEDDICVHPEFLNFHFSCLNTYKKQANIWSNSAYVMPSVAAEFGKLVTDPLVLAQRASSWGWSTWKDRWDMAIWDNHVIRKHVKKHFWAYHLTGGDKIRMLYREMKGQSSSWAIIWDYNHFMNAAYCIYPSSSLVKNIGLDNSGTHSKPHKSYFTDLSAYQSITRFPAVLHPMASVMNAFRRINLKWYRMPFDFLKFFILFMKN